MRQPPPYFSQVHNSGCSLAALRSVLAASAVKVSEEELVDRVKVDYGQRFSNIFNPTIAKLAVEYGVPTIMYAIWPLLKPEVLKEAMKAYEKSPETFNAHKYENPNDNDDMPEPLPLAYKEMFDAVKNGCQAVYGGLNEQLLRKLISEHQLIQVSIRTKQLYPESAGRYHSLLIYDIDGDQVIYHDPAREPGMTCDITKLIRASTDTGAFMAYAVR